MSLVRHAANLLTINSPNGRLWVDLCPSVGGCITAFRKRANSGTVNVFRSYDPTLPLTPLNASSFPLTPFSNRISNCELWFRGQTYKVGPAYGKEPHALHGDGWTSAWEATRQTDHGAVLSLSVGKRAHTPYQYQAEQRLALEDDALVIDTTLTNTAPFALPFGMGHHPYFERSEQTLLRARLPKVWTSSNMVPQNLIDVPQKWDFSIGATVADERLNPPAHGFEGKDLVDHCFSGWDQIAEITWPEKNTRLIIRADPVFQHFVLFIPAKKPFFCAEAVTNAIDGFNLMDQGVHGTGTVTLEPGQSLEGRTRFEVHSH